MGKWQLIHKMYLMLAGCYGICVIALLGMRFTAPTNLDLLFVWDAWTNATGAFMPVLSLAIALVFVKGWERLPKWAYALFIMPILTNVIVWTNPWHHLQYQVFSIIKSEIVFGPYMYLSGIYSYLCLVASLLLMLTFAWKNRSRLYLLQCIMFSLGGLCPLLVSIVATFTSNMPITATPLSFIPTIVFNGVAIYQLHLLDIRPIANQRVLDRISDCYLILSGKGLVVSYNRPFERVFARQFGILENRYLTDCVKKEDISKKTAIYNLITALDSCREGQSSISYEQAITVQEASGIRRYYYVAEVTSLSVNESLSGFVVIFKDVTQLKKSMQQLQDSQTRMMEQERLAFLGQMIGGLAHNLKTPIMSISGCIAASETLIDEAEESLSDPQVEPGDYREMYGEVREWFQKMREACSYMSDIITAIKEQAANASTDQNVTFTLDELIKRAKLLMRHELFTGNCQLEVEQEENLEITLHGDINNLVQVLNNLLSNAIYAQKQAGGGKITVGIHQEENSLNLYVKDTGPGVDPKVKKRLFREMVTSKGTQGTGLGLYISDAVVRGKFGGSMWHRDNPGGGSIFGISIPMEQVLMNKVLEKRGGEAHEEKQVSGEKSVFYSNGG